MKRGRKWYQVVMVVALVLWTWVAREPGQVLTAPDTALSGVDPEGLLARFPPLTEEEMRRAFRQDRAEFIDALSRRPDSEKYLYGLANTLQYLVARYVWSEAKLPTLEEFLASPYNLLAQEAWTNPYSGERVGWSTAPEAGKLYYFFPGGRDSPLLIVPGIEPFDGVRFWKYAMKGRASKYLKGDLSGLWQVYPGSDVQWPTPELAEQLSRSCLNPLSISECGLRLYHVPKNHYQPEEWQTLVLVRTLEGIFNRIAFITGRLPHSLQEVREKYWWLYNTGLRNPFSNRLIQEVPFGTNSPGDFVYGADIGPEGAEPPAYAFFIALGKGGRMLYPFDSRADVNLINLGQAEYIRGLEGRSVCALWREWVENAELESGYQAYCPRHDHTFLTTP